MPLEERNKNFLTTDLYISAWLVNNGISPQLEVQRGRVVFIFEASEQLYRLCNQFNSNVEVGILDFANEVKRLRGEMLAKKESNKQG